MQYVLNALGFVQLAPDTYGQLSKAREKRTTYQAINMHQDALSSFLVECAEILMVDSKFVSATTIGVSGDTPLHIAVSQSQIPLITALIAAGADVNAAGDMLETPLHTAVKRQCVAAIKLLLNHGANPDSMSEFGDSPYDLAQRCGQDIQICFKG